MDVSRFQLLSDTRRVLIEEMLPCSTGRRGAAVGFHYRCAVRSVICRMFFEE